MRVWRNSNNRDIQLRDAKMLLEPRLDIDRILAVDFQESVKVAHRDLKCWTYPADCLDDIRVFLDEIEIIENRFMVEDAVAKQADGIEVSVGAFTILHSNRRTWKRLLMGPFTKFAQDPAIRSQLSPGGIVG